MVEQAEKVGLCDGCNYSLRGLSSNRCPECGHPFDPNDPNTMNMGLPMGRIARAMIQPVEQRKILTLFACLALLWGGAWLAMSFYVFTIGLLLTILLTSYKCYRVFVRWGVAKWHRRPIERQRRLFLWPLLLCLVLEQTGAARRVVLFIHLPVLNQFAQHVYDQVPQSTLRLDANRVGLYYFSNTSMTVGGTLSADCGPNYGLFYVDPGNPTVTANFACGRWGFLSGWEGEWRWYANSLW